MAISLINRLHPRNDQGTQEDIENVDMTNFSSTSTSSNDTPSFSDDPDNFLQNSDRGTNINFQSNFRVVMGKEMSLFESTNTRPANLESLYQSLKTIRPTSVEPERAFSSMGLFSTRLRTRLSDESLDALVFMRQHHKQNFV